MFQAPRIATRTARAGGLLAATLLAALPIAMAGQGPGPTPTPPPPAPEHKQPEAKSRAECWKEFIEDLETCTVVFGPEGTTPDRDAKLACLDGALISFQACTK